MHVQVDDAPAYSDKAKQLGGRTVVPSMEVQSMGQFAWLPGSERTIVGLWNPHAIAPA